MSSIYGEFLGNLPKQWGYLTFKYLDTPKEKNYKNHTLFFNNEVKLMICRNFKKFQNSKAFTLLLFFLTTQKNHFKEKSHQSSKRQFNMRNVSCNFRHIRLASLYHQIAFNTY